MKQKSIEIRNFEQPQMSLELVQSEKKPGK